ncbi:MAG: hypothetical protein JNG85_00875 [Spirochaetaceae bacterium]|nr:hypothetical protein [Spirochaetaceae bacterium]
MKGPSYFGRAAGLAAGLAGGWYGMAAGFLIGYMVDEARNGGQRRRYFSEVGAPRPQESRPGLAPAAGLALRGAWPHAGSPANRRALFAALARKRLRLERKEEKDLERLLEAAAEAEEALLPAFARDLSGAAGGEAARRLLADFAYALSRRKADALSHETDELIRQGLADAGLGLEAARAARAAAFPDYRDPWEILGLEPGTGAEGLKRAYRRLSRRRHPDALAAQALEAGAEVGAAGGEEAAARAALDFAELKDAYDFLKRRIPLHPEK